MVWIEMCFHSNGHSFACTLQKHQYSYHQTSIIFGEVARWPVLMQDFDVFCHSNTWHFYAISSVLIRKIPEDDVPLEKAGD